MTSPRLAAVALAAAFLALPSCAPVNQQPKAPPVTPAGALSKGTLTNEKLRRDTTAGIFTKLMAQGYDMTGDHHVWPYVTSKPKGAPGSRHWTEVWLVAMKDKNVPVKLSFKESGMNAADFEIR